MTRELPAPAETADEQVLRERRPGTLRSRPATPAGARPMLRPALLLMALLAFLGAWAVASPVGSSPDDDYHLGSIWCAQGARGSACLTAPDNPDAFLVPSALVSSQCYAFKAEESAACQSDFTTGSGPYVESVRGNFGVHEGDYPALFYATMSIFVGDDIARSVIVMRLFNVGLLVAMLAGVYAASAARARRAVVATVAVTIIPLGAFIVASVNPSSWSTISAMTLFLSAYGYLTAPRRRRALVLAGLATVALVLGIGSRGDASLYAVIAVGAAVVLWMPLGIPTRGTLLRLILPVVWISVGAFGFLGAGQAASAAGQDAGRGPMVFVVGFWNVFDNWTGALGARGLGWLDTMMPGIVWVFVPAAVFAVMFVGLAHVGVRRGSMVALVALSAAVIPAYIQFVAVQVPGSVQPRYIYPLLIVMVAVGTLAVERRPFLLTQAQRWIVVAAIGIAGGVALYTNLRRYVTGVDVISLSLSPSEWWWDGAWLSPDVVVALGSVGLVVALALGTRVLVRTTVGDDDTLVDDRAVAVVPPSAERSR